MTEEGLGTRAARGAAQTIGGQMAKVLIQLASVVILARILSPTDYGLLAMVAAIMGVADLFRDFGLSNAAIQAKMLNNRQRDNLFWLNTALGLVLTVGIFFAAPLVANIYHQPALIPITHALSLSFLINGISTQYRADLNRSLRFSRLAVVDIIAAATALALAIVVASMGAGYWALVVQQLVQATVMMALVMVAAAWLPRRPRRVPMNGMVRFGWHLVAIQMVSYVSYNTDAFVIGVRFGAGPLGLYNRAFQVLTMPLTQARSAASVVAMPVLARLQDEKERFIQFVLQGQLALGYSLVTVMGGVAGAALPITALFLGQKWLALEPVMVLLAIAGAFQTLAFVGYWVYISLGLTGPLLRYSMAESVVTIVCIVVGSQGGIAGVAAGIAVAQAANWPLSLWWLSHCSGLPLGKLYGSAARIMAVAVVVGAATRLVSVGLAHAHPVLTVGAAGAAGLGAVALMGLLVPAIRRDLASLLDISRRALKRPANR
ncbi:lipopolysaccharide biosynthesis protein [Arthrobacter sp. LAPM80]|uniref:lipopolysaccharide biosynthesis protein n=1 Tax=Arthrobacter sp. LAPM80 TaxID=3141788 RepID=UPI00398A66C0